MSDPTDSDKPIDPTTPVVETPAPSVASVPPTPEDPKKTVARQARLDLMTWLDRLNTTLIDNPNAIMVSRPSGDFLWRQIGFFIEKGQVFAKLGENHYQPIGVLDDECFYPTESSKLLWQQEFGIAGITPCLGAFTVEKVKERVETDENDRTQLTDKNRERLINAFEEIKKVFATFTAAADIGDQKAIEAGEAELLDCLRLCCIQCPPLDRHLQAMRAEHPEIKPDFSGVTPSDLIKPVSEWIRMRLNDDGQRRHFQQRALVPSENGTRRDLLLRSKQHIEQAFGGGNFDAQLMKTVLEGRMVVFPELLVLLKPFVETTEVFQAGEVTLRWVEDELAKLPAPAPIQMPTPSVETTADTVDVTRPSDAA